MLKTVNIYIFQCATFGIGDLFKCAIYFVKPVDLKVLSTLKIIVTLPQGSYNGNINIRVMTVLSRLVISLGRRRPSDILRVLLQGSPLLLGYFRRRKVNVLGPWLLCFFIYISAAEVNAAS